MSGAIVHSDRCSCGLTLDSRVGRAYNEEAFRYLLRVQQQRADRSDQPFFLVLAELKAESGLSVRIDPAIARKLFIGLCRAFRETDAVGWYVEQQIVAAILITRADGSWTETCEEINRRVHQVLSEGLPPAVARSLYVRIRQMKPMGEGRPDGLRD